MSVERCVWAPPYWAFGSIAHRQPESVQRRRLEISFERLTITIPPFTGTVGAIVSASSNVSIDGTTSFTSNSALYDGGENIYTMLLVVYKPLLYTRLLYCRCEEKHSSNKNSAFTDAC